ncbi:hypothetical protein [Microbacterium sp. NPDC076911]|uniref:hypothetical protein n=1 Tax=Microbacterium sp. NPDC076911 TaxID=3154958 RepID=UPI00342A9B45
MTARRRIVALAIAASLIMPLAACTASGEAGGASQAADGVTTEQAQILAITRFRNYDVTSRPFQTALQDSGQQLAITGWVDWVSGEGYAAVASDTSESGVIVWSHESTAATGADLTAGDLPPLPAPTLAEAEADPAWGTRPIDISTSTLDAALATVLALGSDRPDNPLLVQQSGALWLRNDTVDGIEVSVFAAPPSDDAVTELPSADESGLRLWVDQEGTMWRAEVRLGSQWSTIDFGAADGTRLGEAE